MIKIETKQLQEGAILAQPVITPLGQPLAPAGSAVTRQLINRMKLYRVEYAEIEGEEPAPQEEAPKPVKEAKTYSFNFSNEDVYGKKKNKIGVFSDFDTAKDQNPYGDYFKSIN